jgi:hypothetical protein
VRFRNLRLISLLLASAMFIGVATAARYPNTVRQSFVVEGPAGSELAAFFGLSAKDQATLMLPVLDVATMSTDTNYGGLANNQIRFSREGGGPRIEIGDRWHDNETGSGKPVPRYSFTSPFIDTRLTVDNGWTTLLRHLDVKVPEIKTHAAVATHVHTDQDALPFLDVLVYMVYDFLESRWVYRVELGIDRRERAERERALASHEFRVRERAPKPVLNGEGVRGQGQF